MTKIAIAALITSVAAAAVGVYLVKKDRAKEGKPTDTDEFDPLEGIRTEDCDYASEDEEGVTCVYNKDVTCRLAADGKAACDKGETISEMSKVLKRYGSSLKKDGSVLGEHLLACAKELLAVEKAEFPGQVDSVKAGVAGAYTKLKESAQGALSKCHVTEEAQKEAQEKLSNAIKEFNIWIRDLSAEKKCDCNGECPAKGTGCPCSEDDIPAGEDESFAEITKELEKKMATEPKVEASLDSDALGRGFVEELDRISGETADSDVDDGEDEDDSGELDEEIEAEGEDEDDSDDLTEE